MDYDYTDGKQANGLCGGASPGASVTEEPTLAQWKDLYEVAGRINRLAPWAFLWDNELIAIMLPGKEEPVYCSVMGRNDECFAIGVYPGYESIMGYYRLAESSRENALFHAGFEQRCLMCNYGDREEITPKDREVLKALKLKFRGRNEWIYFRTSEPGFLPWYIDSEQADLLIHTLQNLVMACECLESGKIQVNFENNEVLLRSYSEEKAMWINKAAKMPPIPVVTAYLKVDDEVLTANLKKQKRVNQSLEFDMVYLPAPVQEHKEDRPYLPRLVLLADRKGGLPLDQHLAKSDEGIESTVINMIAKHIQKHGRPTAIYVRDERTGRYIMDLCVKSNVKICQGEGMPAMDELLSRMMDFFV